MKMSLERCCFSLANEDADIDVFWWKLFNTDIALIKRCSFGATTFFVRGISIRLVSLLENEWGDAICIGSLIIQLLGTAKSKLICC